MTTAEKPRGTPVFRNLVSDPPTSEVEFIGLWKVYFLTLIGAAFRENGVDNPQAAALLSRLEEAELLKGTPSLQGMLNNAIHYVRRLLSADSLSASVEFDPLSGLAKAVTGKITLKEPSSAEVAQGFESVDTLFTFANAGLEAEKLSLWILLDRLDVAFAESTELEQNGLRSLFKVYLDLLGYPRLSLKIFIRSDIWRRITSQGFREASHITRHVTLEWKPNELLNLIIRRVLTNAELIKHFLIDSQAVLESSANQSHVFYRIFPEKIDMSDKKPPTLDWIITRCADGTGMAAPREIIHLLSAAREQQVRKLEHGEAEPPNEWLFIGQAFKDALPQVSKTRFDQTLLAEYPQYREYLLKLEGKRTQQSIETLADLWLVSHEEAIRIAGLLVECGFFEARETKEGKAFWVPFLYRSCLSMVQGTED